MFYTVGIKRKWLPGFKKYRVSGHRTQFALGEQNLSSPRLILSLEDGSELAIANIMNRDFVLYSDYKDVQAARKEEEDLVREIREENEISKIKDDLYAHYQNSLKSPAPQMSDVVPIQKQA